MPDQLKIRSILRDYQVEFVEDFAVPFRDEISSGGFPVMDSAVFKLYENLSNDLRGKDYLILEAEEFNKTIDKSKEIIERLVDKGVRRNQKLIAVGGGIIQDITAFTASVIYRGIDWVFIPTTLLAQADSCIGSKTSLNLSDKKNLIGTFYPPLRVYIDVDFLKSLSVEDIKSGLGEMMHFYLYAASPYFGKVVENYRKLINDRKLLTEYIKESLLIKKPVVELDEFDRGERNKFNYGHTFGHAIESVTDYKVNHGQAVTIGMDIANYLSFKMGFMDKGVFNELHRGLVINFPQYKFDNFDLDGYIDALSKDKKNIGTGLGCILAEGPGRLFKKQIQPDKDLKASIVEYFSEIYQEGE